MNGSILLFGLPRSGTTWIGKLFDSHPDTLYRHEPDSVQRLGMPLFPAVDAASRHRPELERFVASLPGMRSPEVVGKQPLFAKSYLSTASLFAYRASVLAAKAASKTRRHVPCPYRPTGGNHGDVVYVVWKSIESLGRLGVCAKAMPDARVIHLMRHPCGHVASVLHGRTTHRFDGEASDTDDSWRLKMLLETATGRPYAARLDDLKELTHAEQLAWIWMITHEKVLADTAHSENVLTVRYEDVCDEPVAMTRKMFEFAGLRWHPQTESFVRASTETTRSTTDTDYYSVFKPPRASAEHWRSELAPDAIERIMRILRNSPMARYYTDAGHVSKASSEAVT
ncbi:MAG TPA: sulfotransferase [Rhodanobacteraceae bacterium]